MDSTLNTAILEAPVETQDAVAQLLAESRRWPLLTPAEEVELAQRIERGELEAKNRMINSNLRLVVSNARRYLGQGLPLADLVQEGMLGLIRASEKFDWRKGFRFSTYATLWIRQSIQRGLENSGRTIRLPVHVGQRARKVGRVERELTTRLGREPTNEEIAREAELDLELVLEVKAANRAVTSLDQPVGEDGDTTLGALIPLGEERGPEESAEESARREVVKAALAMRLRSRWRRPASDLGSRVSARSSSRPRLCAGWPIFPSWLPCATRRKPPAPAMVRNVREAPRSGRLSLFGN